MPGAGKALRGSLCIASRRGLSVLNARGCKPLLTLKQLKVTWRIYLPKVSDFWKSPREMHTAKRTGKLLTDPYFELSMICCAFLIAALCTFASFETMIVRSFFGLLKGLREKIHFDTSTHDVSISTCVLYWASIPPSTTSEVPVVNFASSEQR